MPSLTGMCAKSHLAQKVQNIGRNSLEKELLGRGFRFASEVGRFMCYNGLFMFTIGLEGRR